MKLILERGKLTHTNLNHLLNIPSNYTNIFIKHGFSFIEEISSFTLFPLELHNELLMLKQDPLIMKELQVLNYYNNLCDTNIILNDLERKLKYAYNKFQIDICK